MLGRKQHVDTVHMKKKHKCNLCTKVCNSSGDLSKHKQKEHSHKPAVYKMKKTKP